MFGLTLGTLGRRPAWLLGGLISANLVWAAVCIILAVRAPAGVILWGYGHLIGEGAFVAALACLEWRYRRLILELGDTRVVRNYFAGGSASVR